MSESCYQKTVMLVAMKYDYGIRERGCSYEWNHFYCGLKDTFKKLLFFDFIEMQWLMLQQDKPEDYVIGTGEQYSVRDFVDAKRDQLCVKEGFKAVSVQES